MKRLRFKNIENIAFTMWVLSKITMIVLIIVDLILVSKYSAIIDISTKARITADQVVTFSATFNEIFEKFNPILCVIFLVASFMLIPYLYGIKLNNKIDRNNKIRSNLRIRNSKGTTVGVSLFALLISITLSLLFATGFIVMLFN